MNVTSVLTEGVFPTLFNREASAFLAPGTSLIQYFLRKDTKESANNLQKNQHEQYWSEMFAWRYSHWNQSSHFLGDRGLVIYQLLRVKIEKLTQELVLGLRESLTTPFALKAKSLLFWHSLRNWSAFHEKVTMLFWKILCVKRVSRLHWDATLCRPNEAVRRASLKVVVLRKRPSSDFVTLITSSSRVNRAPYTNLLSTKKDPDWWP